MPNTEAAEGLFYPIALSLQNQPVLMIGAGAVAARKLPRLLEAGAQVRIISPSVHPDIPTEHPQVTVIPRVVTLPDDLTAPESPTPRLVFACTNAPACNAEIARQCQSLGIWVNSATDSVSQGDFIVPGLIQEGDLQIALWTGGASPSFVRQMKAHLANSLPAWVKPYLTHIRQAREAIKAQYPDGPDRQAAIRALVQDESLLESFSPSASLPSR